MSDQAHRLHCYNHLSWHNENLSQTVCANTVSSALNLQHSVPVKLKVANVMQDVVDSMTGQAAFVGTANPFALLAEVRLP